MVEIFFCVYALSFQRTYQSSGAASPEFTNVATDNLLKSPTEADLDNSWECCSRGWSHNWDYALSTSGSGLEAMGASSPLNAVATLVALHAAHGIYTDTKTIDTVLMALARNDALDRVSSVIQEAGGSVAGHVPNCIALYNAYLRTALIETGPAVWSGPIDSVMTSSPTTLPHDALVRDAVHVVRSKRFDEIPIVDDAGRPMGLIDVQDLAALKVIEG